MKPPRLNRRLSLETPQKVPDGSGGYQTNWTALGQLWAAVQARSGSERESDGAPVSSISYKIIVRGAPEGSPARPKPEQRFRDGGRLFRIRAVTEMDAGGMYLTCFADEEMVA